MAITNTGGWTDDILIREIRTGGTQRNRAWEYIYKAWRGYYLAPLMRMGASEEQVDDAMAQVVLDIERQILKPDFLLHSTSLSVYFTQCLKRACSKRLSKDSGNIVSVDPEILHNNVQNSVEEDYVNQEMLDEMLDRLGAKCKTVLLLFGKGYSMREIAGEFGYSNEQTAKNIKKDCHQKLLELTQDH